MCRMTREALVHREAPNGSGRAIAFVRCCARCARARRSHASRRARIASSRRINRHSPSLRHHRSCRASGTGGTDRTRSRMIRPRRAPPPCFRDSWRVMHRCVSFARRSATRVCRAFATWPGDRSFPSFLLARQRSWDLHPSQVCSRRRWTPHLCGSGPTCSFDPNDPTRFILVGVASSRSDLNAPRGRGG